MFSGIVEATGKVLTVEKRENVVQVQISKPVDFNDLKIGDSISCNGVCLTVEKFDQHTMQFSLASETLSVLKIDADKLKNQTWNLERSLRFGDRVHGHLVTGHAEFLGKVVRAEAAGESWFLEVQVPLEANHFIWKKGSVALHGVSLTVNNFKDNVISVCLIPETVKRTNLGELKPGQMIYVETDYLAKAYFQSQRGSQQHEL